MICQLYGPEMELTNTCIRSRTLCRIHNAINIRSTAECYIRFLAISQAILCLHCFTISVAGTSTNLSPHYPTDSLTNKFTIDHCPISSPRSSCTNDTPEYQNIICRSLPKASKILKADTATNIHSNILPEMTTSMLMEINTMGGSGYKH
jgi:hypothetical protein